MANRLFAAPLVLAIPAAGPSPLLKADSTVVFNEVHYHAAGDDPSLEWVELHNQMAVDMDLSGWRIAGGIAFDFPEGTVLEGGGYLVVAKDPPALQAAAGHAGALGPFRGRLANGGETLELLNNARPGGPEAAPPTGVPAERIWSVDIQGAGGILPLPDPVTASGPAPVSGLGDRWNSFEVAGHSGVSTDPEISLFDSAGGAGAVRFSLDGRVSGWSQAGSALSADYLFVNAGNADPSVGWTLSGLTAGAAYDLIVFGGVSRDIAITVDAHGDGSLDDDAPRTAAAAGLRFSGIVAGAPGTIVGRAAPGTVREGNWAGLQLIQVGESNDGDSGAAAVEDQTYPGSPATGRRRVMDRLEFGDTGDWPVAPDGSGATLAKLDPDTGSAWPASWAASVAVGGTPGARNVFPSAPPIRFNEVAGALEAEFRVELVNAGAQPVSLSGLAIVSSAAGAPAYDLPAGTLAPGATAVVEGANLGFAPADNDRLFLLDDAGQTVLDATRVDDRPRARSPDGNGPWLVPSAPTFGAPNEGAIVIEDAVVINEIFYHGYPDAGSPGVPPTFEATVAVPLAASWKYDDSGDAPPAGWHGSSFDDAAWSEGVAVVGFEPGSLPEPIRTALANPVENSPYIPAYYFRHAFDIDGDPAAVGGLQLRTLIDDGAVFYLNGEEVFRQNMPAGAIGHSTSSSEAIEAEIVLSPVLPAGVLRAGTNVLAVEVHQQFTLLSPSSDVVFAAELSLLEEGDPGVPARPFTPSDEEWIELLNRGAGPVDLTGWQLEGGVRFGFPPGTVIEPGAFLVVARDPDALRAARPEVAASVVGDFSGRLSDRGETVVLTDANGNPADEVHYFDGGRWPAAPDGGGASLELIDPAADNARAEAWAASDETARSAWRTYSYRGVATDDGIGNDRFHELVVGLLDAGEVLIDDVRVVEDPGGAAVSFLTNGSFQGDAVGTAPAGWQLVGTHGSHGRSVVAPDPDDASNRVLRIVATGATEDKHNHVFTTYAAGRRVTLGREYEISFRARWVSGSNQLNTRLYFNFLQRTTLLDVPGLAGTPGAENSRRAANAGPTFSGFSHAPTVPAAGRAVTVSVRAEDPDGLASLALRWIVNDGSILNGGIGSAAMSETAPGSGVFAAAVPGRSRGDVVQVWVEGEDAAGASATFPAGGSSSRALYIVEDNQANLSRLHNLRIILKPSDAEFLYRETNRMSNDHIPCTVVYDERIVHYDVGVRLKGSAFGRNNPPNDGFNIKFHPDHPFRGVHPSISIERGSNRNELIAKHLFSRGAGGLPSIYDDIGRVVVNRSGKTGTVLFSMARYSGVYLSSVYSDGGRGTLYNHELLYSPNGTIGGLKDPFPYNHDRGRYYIRDYGDDKEALRWGFQVRSNRREDNLAPILALGKAFELEGGLLRDAVSGLIDVDQWMRMFAMMGLNGNDDFYSRLWEHNFRMYHRGDDGRIEALPWDLDRAFRLAANSSPLVGDRDNAGVQLNVRKVILLPEHKRLFDSHVLDLLDTTFNSGYMSRWLSHYGSLSGDNFGGVGSYIAGRAAFARSQLPAEVPFRVTTAGGNDFSVAASSATLRGRGWIDVRDIRLGGGGPSLEVTWTGADTWEVTLPLAAGANAVELLAYNHAGEEVGVDALTITNTGPLEAPSPENLVVSEIMYHPANPAPGEVAAGFDDPRDFEFIELHNIGSGPVDLSGLRIDRGFDFAFAGGALTELAPGAYALVVRRQEAFEARNGPGLPVVGSYGDPLVPGGGAGLSNAGETIRLADASGATVFEVRYGDDAPWPESADGGGPSLVLLDPSGATDPSLPASWRASSAPGGSPGRGDPPPAYDGWRGLHFSAEELADAGFSGDAADPDGDGRSNFFEYATGSDPRTAALSGGVPAAAVDATRPGGPFLTFTYTARTDDPALSSVPEVSPDLLTWSGDAARFEEVSTTDNADGTATVTVRDTVSLGAAGGRRFFRVVYRR